MSAARRPLARADSNASAIRSTPFNSGRSGGPAPAEVLERLGQVLVSPTRQADQIELARPVRQRPGERVRALERRDDPLEARRERERLERLLVGDREIARASAVPQPG